MFLTEGFQVFPRVFSESHCGELMNAMGLVIQSPEEFCTRHFNEDEHLDLRLKRSALPLSIEAAKLRIQEVVETIGSEHFLECQYSSFPHGHPGWANYHIDGQGILQRRELPFEALPEFTAIAGLSLVDQLLPASGNLVVIPKGHQIVARLFDSDPILTRIENPLQYVAKYFDSQPGHEVLLRAGDVVVMHYLMPHRVSGNTRGNRAMLYFRFGNPLVRGVGAFSSSTINFPGKG